VFEEHTECSVVLFSIYTIIFVLLPLKLCDSCEVRTESRFHFVVETLCDSCEVRTESRFHFVMVTLCDSCGV
jgi:hypothetical protein